MRGASIKGKDVVLADGSIAAHDDTAQRLVSQRDIRLITAAHAWGGTHAACNLQGKRHSRRQRRASQHQIALSPRSAIQDEANSACISLEGFRRVNRKMG